MDKDKVYSGSKSQPLCAQEALQLLNCVTQSSFDQDQCIRLLHSLRDCVLKKKVNKFSLADQEKEEAANPSNKNA